ncbi:MAG: tRNA lysidine(34) synthetase TilS, partial [Nitrospinota bacterium]
SLVKDNFGDKIVTCHTLDDSVETSILWMLRGAGPKAFGGIPPIRDVYIRPILNTEKKTILGWLKKANLTYISDPSNETDLYRRNRIRHNIIPELVKEEPTAVRSIANLTQLIKAQSDYIENVAVEKLRKVERKNGLNIDELLQVEMTIRYAIYRLFARNNGLDDRVLTNKKLADLDKLLIAKKLGSTVNLYQNFSFCLDHDGLYIEKGSNITQSISEPFKIPLELKIESLGKLTIMANYKAESKFNVDLDKINQLSSSIRQRIGGDYLINNGHRKSLKKYMIEKSIPDRIRHKLPLIVEGQQVLLIPGWFICEQIKATPMSDNICSVEFEMESDN